MAIADADYRILCANVGCQGRISNGGVLRSTNFHKKLITNELLLPKPTCLSQENEAQIPYVLVADDAFTLCVNLMKPFSDPHSKSSLKSV